jgi:hypothetical protein
MQYVWLAGKSSLWDLAPWQQADDSDVCSMAGEAGEAAAVLAAEVPPASVLARASQHLSTLSVLSGMDKEVMGE